MKKTILLTCVFAMVTGLSFNVMAEPVSKELTIGVSDLFVPEVVERGTEAKIVMSGMFPNSCYRWSRAEVVDVSPLFHTVQAKALVTVNVMCLMVMVPFSKEVNLGQLPPGEHVIRMVSGDETYFERKLTVR